MNQVGNIYCDRCNARLVPAQGLVPPDKAPPTEDSAAGLKGISLPSRSGAAKGEPEPANLPDWLMDLSDETASKPPAPEATPAPAADLPDWMAGLVDADPPEAQGPEEVELAPDSMPDWMTGLLDDTGDSEAGSADTASAPEGDLPDWMTGLVDADAPSPAPAPTATPPRDTGLPDWMADLDADVGDESPEPEAEAEADLPDWMTGLAAESPTSQPAAAPDDMPDWMMADDSPATDAFDEATDAEWEDDAAAYESYAVEVELPPWLEAIADPAAPEPQGTDALPAWILSRADADAPTSADVSDVPPDWWPAVAGTASVAPVSRERPKPPPPQPRKAPAPAPTAAPAPKPKPAPADDLPDWLGGLDLNDDAESAAPAPSPAPAPDGDLPDWLGGLDLDDDAGDDAPAPSPAPEPDDDLPDWLGGLDLDDDAEVAAPAAPVLAPEPAEDIPDWLRGIDLEEDEEEAAAPAVPAPAPEPAEDIPDWLRGIDLEEEDEEEEAAAPAAPASAPEPAEDIPDWLRGIDLEEDEEEVAAPAAPAPAPEPAEDIPDWLRGIDIDDDADDAAPAAPTPEPASDMPDWLGGLDLDDDADDAAPAAPTPAPEPAADMPDWLRGLDLEEDEEEEAAPVVSETATLLMEDDLESAEMPDWLSNLGSEAARDEETPAPATSGPQPSEAPAPEAEEEPDWMEHLTPAPMGKSSKIPDEIADNLARAEVPQWLRGLQPSGTGPLPPLPETTASLPEEFPSEDDSGLARADIPDWVQQLRPAPDATGAGLAEGAMRRPAETEGPLAGLSGVLTALPAVDMPSDHQARTGFAMADAIVQQAQLWQELLENPRSVERPVAQQDHRLGAGAKVARVLVALALLLAVVGGLLLQEDRLSQSPLHPGISDMSTLIQALEPGNTVVVALEYGAAEAVEMSLLTDELFSHLLERQVNVIAVSSLPEGAGLVHDLMATEAISNHLPSGHTAYLPGTYHGITAFLDTSEVRAADMLLIFAARPERLRWWIEQYKVADIGAPVGIGSSASLGPLVAPYFETPGVTGWLVGFRDVVAYRELRGLPNRFFGSMLDVVMLAQWAAAALLIFGLLYQLAAGRKKAV